MRDSSDPVWFELSAGVYEGLMVGRSAARRGGLQGILGLNIAQCQWRKTLNIGVKTDEWKHRAAEDLIRAGADAVVSL